MLTWSFLKHATSLPFSFFELDLERWLGLFLKLRMKIWSLALQWLEIKGMMDSYWVSMETWKCLTACSLQSSLILKVKQGYKGLAARSKRFSLRAGWHLGLLGQSSIAVEAPRSQVWSTSQVAKLFLTLFASKYVCFLIKISKRMKRISDSF